MVVRKVRKVTDMHQVQVQLDTVQVQHTAYGRVYRVGARLRSLGASRRLTRVYNVMESIQVVIQAGQPSGDKT